MLLCPVTNLGGLGEQVEAIKKTSEFVSQLRRVGKGHGTYQWDQDLMATLV
jgi:ferritin heavy chain